MAVGVFKKKSVSSIEESEVRSLDSKIADEDPATVVGNFDKQLEAVHRMLSEPEEEVLDLSDVEVLPLDTDSRLGTRELESLLIELQSFVKLGLTEPSLTLIDRLLDKVRSSGGPEPIRSVVVPRPPRRS